MVIPVSRLQPVVAAASAADPVSAQVKALTACVQRSLALDSENSLERFKQSCLRAIRLGHDMALLVLLASRRESRDCSAVFDEIAEALIQRRSRESLHKFLPIICDKLSPTYLTRMFFIAASMGEQNLVAVCVSLARVELLRETFGPILSAAAFSGQIDVVRYLLEDQQSKESISPEWINRSYRSAVIGVGARHSETIRFLAGRIGKIGLELSVREAHMTSIRFLLDRRRNPWALALLDHEFNAIFERTLSGDANFPQKLLPAFLLPSRILQFSVPNLLEAMEKAIEYNCKEFLDSVVERFPTLSEPDQCLVMDKLTLLRSRA